VLVLGACLGEPAPDPPASGGAAVQETPSATPVPPPPLASLPRFDLPLSVEQAYAAIPHRRTRFRFDASPLPLHERRYLEAMFHLIDQGTRVRVVAWQDLFHRGTTAHDPVGKLSELVRQVDGIEPPARLVAYHRQLRTALVQQRGFFQQWLAAGAGFTARSGAALAAHPGVQSSSAALRSAYGLLMRELASGLEAQERDAFFDYHCALDFL
jgi:hypothetical protein